MKHIEYWEAKDGKRFENRDDCEDYEVKLIENEITYYNHKGELTKDFNNAFTVVLSTELSKEDYLLLNEYYYWTIPNEPGKYVWDEKTEDWVKGEKNNEN